MQHNGITFANTMFTIDYIVRVCLIHFNQSILGTHILFNSRASMIARHRTSIKPYKLELAACLADALM